MSDIEPTRDELNPTPRVDIRIGEMQSGAQVRQPTAEEFGPWDWELDLDQPSIGHGEDLLRVATITIRGKGWPVLTEFEMVDIDPYVEGRTWLIERMADA